MRSTIHLHLVACLVLLASLCHSERAHACSYAIPLYGFQNAPSEGEDKVPINGSWATTGSYGSRANIDAPPPTFVATVKDEAGNHIEGKTTFIPYGKKYVNQGPDVGYTQSAFVLWTPDQPLHLNASYTATIHRPDAQAAGDDSYGEGRFKAVAALEGTATHTGLTLQKIQAEYVDTPAYNRTCEERRPCRDECGCSTFEWSTRYFRIPVLELDFTQPDDPSTSQFYHVIEDVNGKIRDIVWTESAKPNTTFELDHGDEAPIELTIRTFALGESGPVATHEYTLTEEDLPPLESTDFIAEKPPKKCRNRSVTTVHTDGYKAPSQGCASTTSHPMGIAWILFTLCLLLRLRLASNSDRVYAAKQCKN